MPSGVFGDQYSGAYDALYGEEDYDAETALVLEAIRAASLHPVHSIADWGCGTGGHALRFAQQGLVVEGVDLSEAMLAGARKKISDAGFEAQISLQQGDVANTRLQGELDAAVMMFAVLGYQTTNDRVVQTLRNVRSHLKTGGVFIADVWYGPAVLTARPSDRFRVTRRDGRELLRSASTSLDTTAHVARVSFNLWTLEGDRVLGNTTEHHDMRYFFAQELALFLQLTGFDLVSLTAFPSLVEPVSDETWNAILVARAV